ncbi:MAG: hypothetical protein KDK51_04650 [Deltaproteobacteria bacterium]|nr:hypothetical protein [Deltaproteobacteria bacterium]
MKKSLHQYAILFCALFVLFSISNVSAQNQHHKITTEKAQAWNQLIYQTFEDDFLQTNRLDAGIAQLRFYEQKIIETFDSTMQVLPSKYLIEPTVVFYNYNPPVSHPITEQDIEDAEKQVQTIINTFPEPLERIKQDGSITYPAFVLSLFYTDIAKQKNVATYVDRSNTIYIHQNNFDNFLVNEAVAQFAFSHEWGHRLLGFHFYSGMSDDIEHAADCLAGYLLKYTFKISPQQISTQIPERFFQALGRSQVTHGTAQERKDAFFKGYNLSECDYQQCWQ